MSFAWRQGRQRHPLQQEHQQPQPQRARQQNTPHLVSNCLTKVGGFVLTVNLLNSSTGIMTNSDHFNTSTFLMRLVVCRSPGRIDFADREPTIYVVVSVCFSRFEISIPNRKLFIYSSFSALALMTCANWVAGVLMRVTSFVAGALNRPRSLARNTSRLGKSARAIIPDSSIRWLFK